MLIACDIDGTIATNGTYYCRVMVRHLADQMRTILPEEDLEQMRYGEDFWCHPTVKALTKEQRTVLRQYAHAHHKDLDRLENSIPIPGAREALQSVVREGGQIVYVTCRPASAEQLTRAWLATYGFPAAHQVSPCERYHDKYLSIHAVAAPNEPVVLIDDQIDKMVPAFRVLIKHFRSTALSLVKRIAFVQIGAEQPPIFPQPLPFPVLACPSWHPDDLKSAFQHPKISPVPG